MNQLVSYARIAIIALYAVTLAQSQTPNPAAAKTGAVPSFVRFSGTAKDINGDPMNGVVGIIFSLYADEQSSAPLWSEHQNAQLDASGGYKVSLGASNPLPMELFSSGEARWLGVQVSGGTQEKRTLLLSVPYALKAADAETIGGLPPSAFVLAGTFNNAPSASSTSTPTTSSAPAPPPASAVTTAGGTVNTLPLFSTATNIQNSLLSQVGTTTINVGGKLNLPAIGAATTTAGTKSRPQTFMASSFNSGTAAAVNQNFQWQAEPAGNNTASPSGTLNLLFGSGTTVPVETGLKINNKGQLTFAAGQAFPGAGTLTGITTAADSGLAGGGATGNLTLSLLKTCATNQVLQWNGTTWVCATISGGGGGGTVTSIGLKAPGSDFTVSGSPITSSGTLSFAWLVPPTSVVTANALVKRDGTGSFSANVVTATSVSATTPLLGGAGPAVSV